MRKVLSFVLVLTLVLSSFSMAFAAESTSAGLSDIDGNANESAIQVAYDLGIVTGNPDGTFLPTKAVTRAEFAAMITRALAIPESALAGYTATSFKDTTGYGWAVPYLAFCQSKGILLGDGAGNVMPGRTINTNEAVTMVLRAIGYTSNSAELVGVWPANYVTKAQDLGIYDDVAAVVSVDKANAAQIIYNALTVGKVQVATDGTTTAVGTSMLTAGLDCTSAKVTLDGTEDSVINVNEYLGMYGEVYYNSDDEIVAFIPKSTQLIGKIDATDPDVFTTTVGDVDYSTTTGIAAAYGALAANYEMVNGEAGAVAAADELVLNVELSGKTITEVYSVIDWTVTSDARVAASDIADINEDQSLLGVDFVLDDDDNIDMNSFVLEGVNKLSDIAADDVVYVYENADGIAKIEVGSESVTGIVSSFKSTTKFTIAGKTYKNADTKVNGVTNDTPVTVGEVSEDITAYLDVNGYVYDFESTDGGAKNVAIVEKYATGINDQIKIFTQDGTSVVCGYDDTYVGTVAATDDVSNIIGYGLDKDGDINDSNLNNVTGAAVELKSNTVLYATIGGVLVNRTIDSDVVVFTQAANGDYAVSSIDAVDKNTAIANAGLLYESATDFTVIGIIVPAANAKASADDVFAVVNERYTDDLDGDPVDRIVGFADGAKIDKSADDLYFTGAKAVTTPSYATAGGVATLGGVQLFKIDMDANGVINDVDFAENGTGCSMTTAAGVKVTAADGRNSVTVGTGTMLALASDVIVYEVTSDDEYAVYSGSFKAGDVVVAYELDDDTDGYEVVFFTRAYR